MAHIHHVTLDERQFGIKYKKMKLSTDDRPSVRGDSASNPNCKHHILIIGAGVSALLPAWMLLDKGYRVTIIAEHWAWTRGFDQSRRITSQIAAALWEFPPGGCGLTEIESPGPGFATVEHYREWSLQSYEFYKKYHNNVTNRFEREGSSLGLKLADLNQFFYSDVVKNPSANNEEYLKLKALRWAESDGRIDNVREWDRAALERGFASLVNVNFDEENAGPFQSGCTYTAPIINTDKAMSYLMALVKSKGAVLETRRFKGLIRDFGRALLSEHHAHAIINATGLGPKELAGDDDVYPVRGAVRCIENTRKGQFRHLDDAYLVPAQRDLNDHPTKSISIVPRSDDILCVGSIVQPGADEMLTEDSVEVEVMWDRASDFIRRLRHAGPVPGFPFAQGFRPFTKRNVKVRADEGADFPLVHNYGHGGSGWTLGVGTARCAVHIVEQFMALNAQPLPKPLESLKVNISTLENIIVELETAKNNATASSMAVKAIRDRAGFYSLVMAQILKAATAGAGATVKGTESTEWDTEITGTGEGSAIFGSSKASPTAIECWTRLVYSITEHSPAAVDAVSQIKAVSQPDNIPMAAIATLEQGVGMVKESIARLEEALRSAELTRQQSYTADVRTLSENINIKMYGPSRAVAGHKSSEEGEDRKT